MDEVITVSLCFPATIELECVEEFSVRSTLTGDEIIAAAKDYNFAVEENRKPNALILHLWDSTSCYMQGISAATDGKIPERKIKFLFSDKLCNICGRQKECGRTDCGQGIKEGACQYELLTAFVGRLARGGSQPAK